MNDPIDRQKAIDIVKFECGEWTGLAKTIQQQFDRLPSAQPESCDECKHLGEVGE